MDSAAVDANIMRAKRLLFSEVFIGYLPNTRFFLDFWVLAFKMPKLNQAAS